MAGRPPPVPPSDDGKAPGAWSSFSLASRWMGSQEEPSDSGTTTEHSPALASAAASVAVAVPIAADKTPLATQAPAGSGFKSAKSRTRQSFSEPDAWHADTHLTTSPKPAGTDNLQELEHVGSKSWVTPRRRDGPHDASPQASRANPVAADRSSLVGSEADSSNDVAQSPASTEAAEPARGVTADGGVATPLQKSATAPVSSAAKTVGAPTSVARPTGASNSEPFASRQMMPLVMPGGVSCPPMLAQALRTVALDDDVLMELPSAEVRVGPFSLSFRPPRRSSGITPNLHDLPSSSSDRGGHGPASSSDPGVNPEAMEQVAADQSGKQKPSSRSIFASVFGSSRQAVGDAAALTVTAAEEDVLVPLPSVAQALAADRCAVNTFFSAPITAESKVVVSGERTLASMISGLLVPASGAVTGSAITGVEQSTSIQARSTVSTGSSGVVVSSGTNTQGQSDAAGDVKGGIITSSSGWAQSIRGIATADTHKTLSSGRDSEHDDDDDDNEEDHDGGGEILGVTPPNRHSHPSLRLPGRFALADSQAFHRFMASQQHLQARREGRRGVGDASAQEIDDRTADGGVIAPVRLSGEESRASQLASQADTDAGCRSTPAIGASRPHIGSVVANLPSAVVTAALRATIRPVMPALSESEHTARHTTRDALHSTIAALRAAPWGAFETLVESLGEENERLRSRSLLLEEQTAAFKAVISRLEKERTEASRRASAAESERDSLRAAVERLRSTSGGGFQGSVSRAVKAVHSIIEAPVTSDEVLPGHAEAVSEDHDEPAEPPAAAASPPMASIDTLDSLVDSVRHLLIVLEDAVEREARHASAQSLGGTGSASVWAAAGRDRQRSDTSLGPSQRSDTAESTRASDSDGVDTETAGAAALSGAGSSQASIPRVVRGSSVSSRPMGDMIAGGSGRGGRGLGILCLDGGGVKGLCMLEALIHIEKRTGRCIHELFDIICGTSTGGLLATLLAMKRMPLVEIPAVYETIRKRMEDNTTVVTNMARLAGGVSYDDKMTEELLREILGEEKLDEVPTIPKCFVVAAACNSTPAQPYLFRSYQLTRAASAASEFMGASNCKVWEAIRCTTAAPTYYNPAVVGKQRFVDGGILANNPTLIALAEAAVLWPDATVSCVVSLGTGMPSSRKHTASSALDWAGYIISDLCMSSHVTHAIASSLLGEGQYFRIDPPCVDVALSETKPAVIQGMLGNVRAYLEEEEQQRTIRRIARLLTSRKTVSSTPSGQLSSSSAAASAAASSGKGASTVPAAAVGHHPLSAQPAAATQDS